MANQKMGFEGLIYHGTTGSTATTLLENTKDITYTLDTEEGDTTVRGDSTTAPIKTAAVTAKVVSIEWTMINDTTDTALTALKTAAYAGTDVAIRTKDHSSGKGFDGDCNLKFTEGMPLAGEQTYTITASPNRNTRTPVVYT